MCNPTLINELQRNKHFLATRHIEAFHDGGWYCYITGKDNPSALDLFLAELPQRRHYEAMEREYEEQQKHGGRTICPECGERSVTSRDVCTLGRPGHPGAEYSAYYSCSNCGWEEL